MTRPGPHRYDRAGLAAALGTHAIWGSMPLYLLLVKTVPAVEYVAWRILFTLPLCLAALAWRQAGDEVRAVLRDRKALLTLFGSASLIAVNWFLYVWAINSGHVYAASFDGNAVTAFQREPATGKLTFLAAYQDGVGGVDGLGYSSAVAVSPDGARLLATGFNDNAISVFARNPTTGLLVQTQVVMRDTKTQLPALGGARDVAISADGSSVYATGFNDNQVVAFQFKTWQAWLPLLSK